MKRLSMAMTALAVLGLMTMVSCRKPNVGNVPGEARTITFNATTESGNGSKTTLEGLDVNWSAGDHISVNGNDNKLTLDGDGGSTFGRFTGTITAAAPYLVGYPADATNDGTNITFTIDDEQDGDPDFDSKLPMAAYTTVENGDLSFRNMVNVLKLDLTGSQTIKMIEVESAAENLSGSFTVGTGLTATHVSTGDMTKKITIKYATPLTLSGDPENPTEVYVVLPVFGSSESTVTVKFTGDDGEMTVGPKALTGSTTPNHRYNAPVEVSLVAPLYIPGDFTVCASPLKKVNFAKGNLYWDGSSWKLEANQWDYRTWAGKNSCIGGTVTTDGTPTNHCGLFKWSDAANAVTGDYNYSGDLFCASGFEVEGETWFTLSDDEWGNLLGISGAPSPRDNASSLCGWVTLTDVGVPGLVILPDNTENPATVLSGITTAEDLAPAGAVFLPAAGERSGTNLFCVSSIGYYWTSTPIGSDGAYRIRFDSDGVYPQSFDFRLDGYCVRLVR